MNSVYKQTKKKKKKQYNMNNTSCTIRTRSLEICAYLKYALKV